MFSKHLVKVIIGFCAVIVIGLVSLVFIDSMKDKDSRATPATEAGALK